MKIVLLTPYWGGNLGDAAIQEAAINNIRRRHPDAEICLVTLNPETTCKLHNLSSFPITLFAVTNYSNRLANKSHNNESNIYISQKYGLISQAKTFIKRVPVLFTILKKAVRLFRAFVRWPNLIFLEICHFLKARRFTKGSSLLIVSGGGQLDDYWGGAWGHPYALVKWGLIAKAVSAKYIFLSVGTCTLDSKLSTYFIRIALRLANYRSYRDQTSKRLLEHMFFTHKDEVYPDLAFSYEKVKMTSCKKKTDNRKIVGVNPIAYLSQHSWPQKDEMVYKAYLKNLVDFIKNIIQQDYSLLLFSTDTPDRQVINEIVDMLSKDLSIGLADRILQPLTGTLNELFDELTKLNYVVASRLHGIILSNLVCNPVLAISYDRKVDTYMADIGLSEYCLDIHKLESISLMNTFASLVSNNDMIKSKLKKVNSEYFSNLRHQYDFILRS